MTRRIAAIVLPRLLCEVAAPLTATQTRRRPFGVVRVPAHQDPTQPLSDRTLLDAVDQRARNLGLREGLTIAEAHAFVAGLELRTITQPQVDEALARIAEASLAFSPTVALQPPDVVHLDATGVAHLTHGERPLIEALAQQTERLGHFARIAVASGPCIAEAVARHGPAPLQVVEPGRDAQSLQDLPIGALPIDDDTACWLVRVGVVTVRDLCRLPWSQIAPRLGPRAPAIRMLADGHDTTPLCPYASPSTVCEETSWDEGIDQHSALLFVLNRLAARVSARLQGRGQALRAMLLTLDHDRAIARHRGIPEASTSRIDLPAPISRTEDLIRPLRARLDQTHLPAPVVGLRLEAPVIVDAPRIQLDLSRDATAAPDALPVLVAEIASEVGPDRVGTLSLHPTHRPETRSSLSPVDLTSRDDSNYAPTFGAGVTRLLPHPIPFGLVRLTPGHLLPIDPLPPLEIRTVRFDARLDSVEWWTPAPCSRDYFQLWLDAGGHGAWAWVYRDRHSGSVHLHGWLD